ncbi:MAG: hypothetical protein GY765_44055 [bacterium]|nr:hypothetical protein [bacterium]
MNNRKRKNESHCVRTAETAPPVKKRRQIPLRLWRRHIRTLIRYTTLKKIHNAVRGYRHFKRSDTFITTLPLFLKVELSRHCTVHCTTCVYPKDHRFYPFEDFRALVDRFASTVFMAQLYEIGEPLHHPELLQCIRYAHKKKMATVVSSTLSLEKPDAYWKDLVTSGLDRLIIAIDGTTEAVYNRYRRHGNFGLVMANLEKILRFREEAGSGPFIEWQMIDFPWNRGEQGAARKLSAQLGCDFFQIIRNTSQSRRAAAKSNHIRTGNCIWAYALLLVNVYGDVLPCFKPAYEPGTLGNLGDSNFADIWNGEEVRRIRCKEAIQSRPGCRNCVE